MQFYYLKRGANKPINTVTIPFSVAVCVTCEHWRAPDYLPVLRLYWDALDSTLAANLKGTCGTCKKDGKVKTGNEFCAKFEPKHTPTPEEMKATLSAEIERLSNEKDNAISVQDFPRAATLRDEVDKLKKQRDELK